MNPTSKPSAVLFSIVIRNSVDAKYRVSTKNLSRAGNHRNFHIHIFGQAGYLNGFAGGGVAAGIRLGILLEIAAIGMRMGFYAVQPFPGKLIVYGSISGLIEMIIVGAIVGAIYKPTSERTP